MHLLGYDIGSSSIKASLVDASTNQVVATATYPDQEMDMISRQKGWAEQQPEIWWNHICIVTTKLIKSTKVKPKDIKGIGISYQMHGLVLIDKDLQVLRPAIIWCDSRAVPIGKQVFADLGEEYCLSNLLNSPGNFTASKLKWVKYHEPEVYKKIYKIMLPGDFINMKLTGEVNTTISGLSEAVLWNFKEKRIATEVLDYFEIDHNLIPQLTSTFSIMGKVTSAAAAQTGLHKNIPVTYRAGDQPNNALSLNVLKKGEVAATSGTSGVVYGIVDKPIFDRQSRVNAFSHVNYEDNYDKIGILLCLNGAGIEYRWMKHQIALGNSTYQDMEQMASSVSVGAEGVCILPFGNGAERIFENKNLGSHITNLEFNRHTRAHLYRASLEAVAFSFVYGMNILSDMGLDLDVIRVSNDNMFQSKTFSTTIATLVGSQIELVDTTGSVGAAKAAGVKADIYDSIEEAMISTTPKMIYEPDPNFGIYNQAYNHWQNELMKRLNGSFENSTKLQSAFIENDKLKKSNRSKNSTIASASIKISIYNKLLKDINKNLRKLYDEAPSEEIKMLLTKIKKIDLKSNEEEKDIIEEHLDILNDGFVKKLKENCPALTFEELKMCTLLKINLSTKEIAQKLNLSVRGVETKRYRIRKKLKVGLGINLMKHFALITS